MLSDSPGPPRDRRHGSGGSRRAGVSFLIGGAIAWTLAVVLLGFHETGGLPSQRIRIRWAPGLTDADRTRVEQQAGLADGETHEPRTWTYLLRNQSRGNVERLVSNPLVEATAHIDRTNFRVELDRPDLPAWLHSLEETSRVVPLALLLLVAGAAALWKARVAIATAVAASWRLAGRSLNQFDNSESAARILERGDAPVRRSRRLVDLVLVALASTGLLALCSQSLGFDRLHINLQNDQINYITAARELVDSGRLNSHVIYPSTLYQDKAINYLYMPGFAYVLASSYTLFGYGVLQSLLPNLLSFVLTALCVYLIGAKLGGRVVGFIGAGFFVLFPPNLFFATTVMAESTLALATTFAIVVFVFLPARARVCVGPLLVLVPFMFRETGFLLIAPLFMLLLAWNRRRKFTNAVAFALLAVSLLLVVIQSPFSQDRPVLLSVNLFDDRFETKYTDAVAARNVSSLGYLERMRRLQAKIERNLGDAFRLRASRSEEYLLFAATVLAAAVGVRLRNMFCLAAALFTFLVLGVVVAFYRWEMRIALFTVPMLSVALAMGFARYVIRPLQNWSPVVRYGLALTIVLLFSSYTYVRLNNYWSSAREKDAQDDLFTRVLEEVPIDHSRVVIAPYTIIFDYALRHYPVKHSFPPANAETLDLLKERYPIGTVILPEGSTLPWFTSGTLHDIGLSFSRTIRLGDLNYVVYQR